MNPMLGAMMPPEIHKVRNECMTELGIEIPKDRPRGPPPKEMDPKFKCLDKCILEKLEVISADGTFNDKDIPAELKETATKCFEENKALEACERAHKYMKCNFKAIAEGLKVLSDTCAAETNTEIKPPQGHGPPRPGMFEEMMKDESKACYHRCVMIKMKRMDENDDFIVDAMTTFAPEGVDIKAIAETCTNDNNQDDKCIKAAQRGLCFMQEMKKNFKQ